MKHGSAVTAIVSATACVLSGCNSPETVYAQGPWGPAHIRRNYPEYSAPWGGRQSEVRPAFVVTEPNASRIETVDAVRGGHSHRTSEALLEMEQPVRPLVPGSKDKDISLPPPADPQLPGAAPAGNLPSTAHQAKLPEQENPPGVFSSPRRASSYAGTWKAVVGTSSCRVQLSSAPSLDLYKASTQGCTNNALDKVNGWSFREEKILLFSRGEVVARLPGQEASLEGTTSATGTPIQLSR